MQTVWSYNRSLTSRGVLWLGLKCDLRCKFCYDGNIAPTLKRWVKTQDLITALDRFRHFYGNRFIDFMGGEPTLHPDILLLIEHSASIGLLPTCITHALHLDQPEAVKRFVSAGIHDFLISVHGIGRSARTIHRVEYDTWKRQRRALGLIAETGIQIRFNVTIIRDNVKQLSDIARTCVEVGGRIINFIAFNPYFEWQATTEIPFQIRHSEVVQHLIEAIEICNSNGIEANVRYMPLCMLPEYEKHVFTGYQLPYDPHEWDYNSWYDQGERGQQSRDWFFTASEIQRLRHDYIRPDACADCSARKICDGLHIQYVKRWSTQELSPMSGTAIDDPTHFIRNQRKLIYIDQSSVALPLRVAGTDEHLKATQFQKKQNYRGGVKDD